MANDAPDAPIADTGSIQSPDSTEGTYGGHETASDQGSDDWNQLSGFEEATAGVETLTPPTPPQDANPAETTPVSAQTVPKPGAIPETKPGATAVAPPPVAVQPPVQSEIKSPASEPHPQSSQPSAAAQPSTAGSELDEMVGAFSKHLPELVEQLAKEQFALSPQMVDALANGEGATQFPRLFAQVHARSVLTTMQMVQNVVPRLIQEGISKFRTEANRDSSFFRQFPNLTREKHGSDIKAMAQVIRQQNPRIDEASLLSKVGTAVMAMHGIVAAAAPQTPPATQRASNGASFVPAAAGRPASVRSQPAADSPYEGLWKED